MPKVKKTTTKLADSEAENEAQNGNEEPEVEGLKDLEDQQELEEIENVVSQSEVILAEERRFPNLPKAPTFSQFIKWRDRLNQSQLDHLKLYLYRTWPIINRKQIDPSTPKHIEVFSKKETDVTRLNEDYIREEHGGGIYDVFILDTDKATQQMISRTSLEIPINQCAPKLVYAEVVLGHNRNRKYEDFLRNRGMIDELGNIKDDFMEPKKEEPKGDAAVFAKLFDRMMNMYESMSREQMQARLDAAKLPDKEGEVMSKVIDMMKSGSDKAQEMLLQRMGEQDPQKMLTLLTTLLGIVKPDSSSNMEIYKMMMEMHKAQADMQQKQFEATIKLMEVGKKESNQLKETMEIMGMMREFFDVGRGAKTSTLETILTHLPGVVNPLAGMVSNLMALRKGQPTQPIAPRPNPQGEIEGHPSPQGATNGQGGEMAGLAGFIKANGEFIIQHLNRGTDGAELMDVLADAFGDDAAGQIHAVVARAGVENMILAMKSVPEFWNRVSTREGQVREFVDRFIRYPEIAQTEGAEGEGEGEEVN